MSTQLELNSSLLKCQNLIYSLEIPLNKPFPFVPVPSHSDSGLLPGTFWRVYFCLKLLLNIHNNQKKKSPQKQRRSYKFRTPSMWKLGIILATLFKSFWKGTGRSTHWYPHFLVSCWLYALFCTPSVSEGAILLLFLIPQFPGPLHRSLQLPPIRSYWFDML